MYISDMKKEDYPEEFIIESAKTMLDSEWLFRGGIGTFALKQYVSDYLNERGYEDFMANELPALLTTLIMMLGEDIQVYPCSDWYGDRKMMLVKSEEAQDKFNSMFNIIRTIEKLGTNISDIDACLNEILGLDESTNQILKHNEAIIAKKICNAARLYAAYGDYTVKLTSMTGYYLLKEEDWKEATKTHKYYPCPKRG